MNAEQKSRELAEKALDAAAEIARHQARHHGPWPAWCGDCLSPHDEAQRVGKRLCDYHDPSLIKAYAEVVAQAREAESQTHSWPYPTRAVCQGNCPRGLVLRALDSLSQERSE